MDAARYINEEWDAISPAEIGNMFQKPDLKIDLKKESHINDVYIQETINGFQSPNVEITVTNFETSFVAFDN